MNQQNFLNKMISVVFHPILSPSFATLIFLIYTPRFIHDYYKLVFFLITFIGTVIFPLLLLYILRLNGVISSFYLDNLQERKYPFVIFTVLALLLSKIFFKTGNSYDLGVYFIAGSMAFLIGYWFLWFKIKLSIHTLGLGSFLGFLFQMSLMYQINLLVLIATSFVVFGLVSKARIELGAHNLKETVWGFVCGVLPQLLMPFLYQNI